MSHFNVLVVGPETWRELDRVLEPYDEHITFPPYIKFTREDKAAERKRFIKYYKQILRGQISQTAEQILSMSAELATLIDMSDEQYFQNATKFYDISAQNTAGEPISTYNPNSRWNTWDYVKSLPMNHGKVVSGCKKKDIDWQFIEMINRRNSEINWPKIAKFLGKTSARKMMYDYWADETEEEYKDRKSMFMTHAYILHGKWYERGKIGWWAETTEEMDREKWINQYTKMLREVKPNTVLTTINCHI